MSAQRVPVYAPFAKKCPTLIELKSKENEANEKFNIKTDRAESWGEGHSIDAVSVGDSVRIHTSILWARSATFFSRYIHFTMDLRERFLFVVILMIHRTHHIYLVRTRTYKWRVRQYLVIRWIIRNSHSYSYSSFELCNLSRYDDGWDAECTHEYPDNRFYAKWRKEGKKEKKKKNENIESTRNDKNSYAVIWNEWKKAKSDSLWIRRLRTTLFS